MLVASDDVAVLAHYLPIIRRLDKWNKSTKKKTFIWKEVFPEDYLEGAAL